MAATAYWLAGGSQAPTEWYIMQAVRKYGAQAVMGRALGFGEIMRFEYIEEKVREHAKQVSNGEHSGS